MAVIQSLGAVQSLAGPHPSWDTHASIPLNDGQFAVYAKIYRTQPHVRTVIDLLADSIAQIGIHLYRRLSDTDRERVTYHPVTNCLNSPNVSITRFEHMQQTVQDIALYDRAYWLKIRPRTRGASLGLARVPPASVSTVGGLFPSRYIVNVSGRETAFDVSEVIHFRGPNPENPIDGLSKMDTLRDVLAGMWAEEKNRKGFFQNYGQVPGFFIREAEVGAGKWNAEQVDTWKEKYANRYAGGSNAGKTPVLPPGMTFLANSYTAQESQYLESRKLGMEICANVFHMPHAMVGLNSGISYGNFLEAKKSFYQKTIPPWTVKIEERIEKDLLPEFSDTERMYFEFNLAEMLKGSFEEQASSLQTLTGRKQIMTQNEGRARLNLPRMDNPEADELSSEVAGAPGRPEEVDAVKQPPRAPQRADTAAVSVVLRGLFSRQQQRLAKVAPQDRAAAFDAKRWTAELAQDLEPLYAAAGLDDSESAAWKVAGAITYETIVALQGHRECFTAARADALSERVATGVV